MARGGSCGNDGMRDECVLNACRRNDKGPLKHDTPGAVFPNASVPLSGVTEKNPAGGWAQFNSVDSSQCS